MAFELFTQLFTKIDQSTEKYVTEISSQAISAITPVVSVGLTLSFILYGWLIIRGAVDMPIANFMGRCIRIALITSLALTSGLYQKDIAKIVTDVPDELVSALIKNTKSNIKDNNVAAGLIDQAAGQGFNRASEAFEEAAFFGSDGLIYGLFGILILLSTSILVAIGGGFILLAKIALSLLAGLGPLFIVALLWQPTYRFFEQWISQVLNYGLLILLFSTIFSIMMNIFNNYVKEIKFDGTQNVSYALGGVLILSVISIVLLIKLSKVADVLAKGFSLRRLWDINAK
ncbi:type IV secretion system protein [Bartonella sp. F02]|uniref:type IV secretion system protein n=1 Tax=Bartonella sp. F02 TaxID=2967262 RepID=UPI0022A96092|nr:type IV secretion system protein [Bartonella sp. F02]MCZ2329034.1 type IV secretion system protein [Bartonella sp. F02]